MFIFLTVNLIDFLIYHLILTIKHNKNDRFNTENIDNLTKLKVELISLAHRAIESNLQSDLFKIIFVNPGGPSN